MTDRGEIIGVSGACIGTQFEAYLRVIDADAMVRQTLQQLYGAPSDRQVIESAIPTTGQEPEDVWVREMRIRASLRRLQNGVFNPEEGV